ncbi:MAG TPA: 3-deoxy-D-manno-octulosonic acid transferase [Terriglobales bacterium]|jgi:3-deoxy-D-manno-octulosonic-acid transferase|nr:3-deoxy-D-manno-octulosonic acid transferase [Terriglobales bacterium]
MYWIYSALLGVAMVVSLPLWIWQMLRHGKYRVGFRERLGRVPARLGTKEGMRCIWVHAVSVGEVIAVTGLVKGLRARFPRHRVVISTVTDTGQELARARFGEENVFYFPLDFAFAIRPYLRRLRPELMVIAETEFWPNFLRLARHSGARAAVVNGRISDRSVRGYRRWRFFLRRVLLNIDVFLTQTEQDRERLESIGALTQRIRVTGNLKFDTPAPEASPIVESLRAAMPPSGPVLVCGSTVEDEEPLLLRAFENIRASYPDAVMILAPRHPERFAEVAQLLEQLDVPFRRRSLWNGEPFAGGVFLVDSIGELASLYALADIAFVGGSLVPRGGHNIIEPAKHGVPIVVGNHTENFRDIIWLFRQNDAVRIVGPAELPLVLMDLLAHVEERDGLGKRAAETLKTQTGATERTLQALEKLLAS